MSREMAQPRPARRSGRGVPAREARRCRESRETPGVGGMEAKQEERT